ncbi:MAG: hypothetical protein K2X36_06565, partial [Microbacteriaceae bacterium]|nr:hypothetical protein [Microbacteriaceae bacterium]
VMGAPITAQSLLTRPEYSEASITSAAGGQAGRIAPNSIVSLYGKNLSQIVWAISPQDLLRGILPTATPFDAVYLLLSDRRVPLFYVSATQINALIPPDVVPGVGDIQLSRDLLAGPVVRVRIATEAPELFGMPEGFVAATHPDGRVVTVEQPAEADGVVVLYGTGFGPLRFGEQGVLVPTRASEVVRAREYRVRLNGEELPGNALLYVGVTPGFAGLYQVNVRMPKVLEEHPRIELGVGGNWSTGQLRLATRKSATP